jgi:hypothetical protein
MTARGALLRARGGGEHGRRQSCGNQPGEQRPPQNIEYQVHGRKQAFVMNP